jgi:hypothetical protein
VKITDDCTALTINDSLVLYLRDKKGHQTIVTLCSSELADVVHVHHKPAETAPQQFHVQTVTVKK